MKASCYLPLHNSGGVLCHTLQCLSLRLQFVSRQLLQFSSDALKLAGQLDHEVIQHILFRGYSAPNFDRVITLFNLFSDLALFPDYSYSFHQIGLKHGS